MCVKDWSTYSTIVRFGPLTTNVDLDIVDDKYRIISSLLGLLKNNDRARSTRLSFLRRSRRDGLSRFDRHLSIVLKPFSENTVEPLVTDTSIIRTPLYYGQFVWSQKCQKSYIPYLYNTDTSVNRTVGSVPLVSVLKRFYCNTLFKTMEGCINGVLSCWFFRSLFSTMSEMILD